MKIGINASFVRKPGSGIGQVTLNALKSLSGFNFPIFDKASGDKNIEYILYLEENLDLELSKKFQKNVFLPFYKRDDLIRKVIWEKYLLPKKIIKDGCTEFISFYQCPTIISKKIKHTIIVHDIIPELFPEYLNNWRKKLYWNWTKKAIRKADKIIAVSNHTKNDLIKCLGIAENKITVRYIDVDNIYKKEISETGAEAVLKRYDLTKGYIYSGGGLEKRKNINALIYAYKLMLDKDENIPDLVISGKLMPNLAPLIVDVEKLVKELQLQNNVRLLDFVAQQDLPAIYKNASVFVYPSLYEGFGLPPLEAMNMGTPVIYPNNSSLGEIMGEAGLIFNSQSTQDLADKISKVLKNENLQTELSQKGLAQAKKFNWENFIS